MKLFLRSKYKSIYRTILLTTLALFLLPALATASPGEYPKVVEDALGHRITLESKPERIVLAGKATLITANTFYLFEESRDSVVAIGQTNQGLGNFLPYLDEDFESIPKLAHEVGPEQIVAHRPDLVIVKDFMYQRLGSKLAKLGIPVLSLSLESPESYQDEVMILGEVLGDTARAHEIAEIYAERLGGVRAKTAQLKESEKPSVLLVYYSIRGGETSFNIPPKGWIQTFQVSAAGGDPIWAESNIGSGWKTVNFEQIAAWDPDYIVVTSFHTPTDSFFQDILESPQWKQLRANRNGNVLAFPADFYSWAQPDVRWILGVQWLAKVFHPSIFADMNFQKEVQTFYRDMYKIDSGTYAAAVEPRLELKTD